MVDGGDFALWAGNYQQPGGWGDGDFSGDGFLDGGDFTLCADNYTGSGGGAEALPAAAYDAGDSSAGAPAGMLQQLLGQRAGGGADLQDGLAAGELRQLEQLAHEVGVDEEPLAEAPLRALPGR